MSCTCKNRKYLNFLKDIMISDDLRGFFDHLKSALEAFISLTYKHCFKLRCVYFLLYQSRSQKSASKDLICCCPCLSLSQKLHQFMSHSHLCVSMQFKIPNEFQKNSDRILIEFPKNSQRVSKEIPMNSQKSKKNPK